MNQKITPALYYTWTVSSVILFSMLGVNSCVFGIFATRDKSLYPNAN
jgi:hypothetical protein